MHYCHCQLKQNKKIRAMLTSFVGVEIKSRISPCLRKYSPTVSVIHIGEQLTV